MCPLCRCGSADRDEMMLLCDVCDAGWHMDCLPVPLLSVPEGMRHIYVYTHTHIYIYIYVCVCVYV